MKITIEIPPEEVSSILSFNTEFAAVITKAVTEQCVKQSMEINQGIMGEMFPWLKGGKV
ncbi:hypothetical protein M316_0009 [Nitrincola phage 1M3-16]|uniref:hypothetical protein n=1 Tax=Nitrincola phage 1M3-16 TaxID=1472912 RepID=UPI000444DA72|nr:hypothetical protein GJ22_gp143 [Nitrincola phage 1M3-16]AHX01074.1 hypothetical protein M316_0009 [Nitrincola phage 1M3-16]